MLKKGEKYGVRVKWSAAGRGILTVLGRRFAQFTHDIEADKIYVTGGNHSDDCIPLIRKLATRIKVLCGTDAYRRESWSTVLAQTEATDVFVNSSITNDLDSLTPTKEEAPRDYKRSKPYTPRYMPFNNEDIPTFAREVLGNQRCACVCPFRCALVCLFV